MKFTIDVPVKPAAKYWINANTIYTIEGMLRVCEECGYELYKVDEGQICWGLQGAKYPVFNFNRATLCET